MLPFHEVTNEIATRTVPTALDLLVAIFSALAAAYTTVRRTSDTTAAAAGTAVAIALVPPVSVIGYGIGTADAAITGGSALLFTANFSAILLFAVLSFLALGYDAVDAESLEARALTSRATRFDRIAASGQGTLKRAFSSRYGGLMRIAVPMAFLAAVFFPLTSALEEVTWQVQRSTAVRQILAELVPDAVQQVVRIERGSVELRLLVVSDDVSPVDLERRLSTAIAAATGVEPVVQVVAVPDLAALTRARTSQTEKMPMAATIVPAVDQARGRLSTILARSWPRGAGALAGWRLEVPPTGAPIVVVYHLGQAIGPVADELLAAALAPALDIRPRIADRPLDATVFSPGRDTADWLVRVDTALLVAPWVNSVLACVTVRAVDSASTWEDSLRRRATLNPRTVRIDTASQWQFQWRSGQCNPARRDTTTAPGTPSAP